MRATAEDVDAICGALPETELGVSWGDRPTWKVPRGPRGKGFVIYRAPGPTAIDPATGVPFTDLLVVSCPDLGARQELVDDPALPFFTVDHFRGHPAVLVQRSRLGEVDRDELVEILTDAWASKAPRRLVREHLG